MFEFMKANQRGVRVPPTFSDRVLEAVVVVLLVILWGMTLYFWHLLPDEIPTHFDLYGHPNGYGSKAVLFLQAGMATFVTVLTGISAYYPKMINMPVTVKTPRQYGLLCRMARVMNVLLILLFYAILLNMALAPLGIRPALLAWTDMAIVGLLLGTILWYSWRIHKARSC